MSETSSLESNSTDKIEGKSKRPNPIDKHVGQQLRTRRVSMGLSQEKLGERLGLTFQQVQKYEKGANRIGASRLYEIANVLDVSVQYFFENITLPTEGEPTASGFSEKPTSFDVSEFAGSPDGVELNKAFVEIRDASVRRQVLDLVKAIARSNRS